MIDKEPGHIDYDETGAGPTIVLVPGSCSTGAAWRPVMSGWPGRYRCVTTSLLGYGSTTERRSAVDTDIAHEALLVESVIRRAGGPVHAVGHSFGGLILIAVALRKLVPLSSLTIVEAPAAELLRTSGEHQHYRDFRDMTDAYFSAFHRGEKDAIGRMIDFYGGTGTFASWPARVRDYACETTPTNLLDWASGFGFDLTPQRLEEIGVPTLVLFGSQSHAATKRANELLGEYIASATTTVISAAAHFMIATHAAEVAAAIAHHVDEVERQR